MSACFGTKRVMPDTMPPDPAKHVNYVRGMVLEVDEFKQEFAYHAGRDRSLAREAIGYGTLRGLALGWVKDSAGKLQPSVLVKAGIALSPCGQLVCVGSDQCADINLWLAARTDEISAKFAADATTGALTLYVTLAYSDCPTDDVPVPGEPCRSEQDLMQPSRITDSFQMELSYNAPLQSEEDALCGFYSWLRKLKIVDDTGVSLALDAFIDAVRNWDSTSLDPTTITIKVSDVPTYSSAALRLWVTELRANVERNAAHQSFIIWLNSVKDSNAGTTSEQEFLAEVNGWTPRTYSWPSAIVLNSTNRTAFIDKAKALWDTVLVPKWYAEPCGCRTPNNPEYCDDRLLLGTLRFKVVKTAGNSWEVVIPPTPNSDTPVVDESRRPLLGQLRALEAQLIPTPESVVEGISTPLSLTQSITTKHVALGRLVPGKAQTTPIFGNLKASIPNPGEVLFNFDGYSVPDIHHDYVTDVMASYFTTLPMKSQPSVRFKEFRNEGFAYKVTRANSDLTMIELGTMEFQVNVSIIEKH